MFEDPNVLKRLRFVLSIQAGELSISEASRQTGLSRTAIKSYIKRYDECGPEGLRNRPRGIFEPLSSDTEQLILQKKKKRRSRSCRRIRDLLRKEGIEVDRQTVWRVLVKHDENKRVMTPLKPDKDFEYPEPNDAWQIDIMDGIIIKGLGLVYLHSLIDDHSRYLVGSGWFTNKSAESMLKVLKEAFEKNGLPKRIIADRGTQFRNNLGPGLTKYQKILERLGIEAIFTGKGNAKSKGKKERFYRFTQEDFLQEFDFKSEGDLNNKWVEWYGWYNTQHEHSSLGGSPPYERYKRVRKRTSPFPLEDVFATIEKRKVRTNATVSFHKNIYLVNPEYIGKTVELRAFDNQIRVFHRGLLLGVHDARINYRERMLRRIHTRIVHKDGTIRFQGKRYFVGVPYNRRRLELMKNGQEVHVFLSSRKKKVFKVKRRYKKRHQG